MPTQTKAPRREVKLHCPNCLLGEIDRLERAHEAGTLTSTGSWTPAQNLWHIARLIQGSYDGFDFKVPAPIRLGGAVLKPFILGKPIRPGLGTSDALKPPADIPFPDAAAALRRQAERMKAGEQMTQPSPVFGKLNHDQWKDLHLRHAELHLGFLDPGQG